LDDFVPAFRLLAFLQSQQFLIVKIEIIWYKKKI